MSALQMPGLRAELLHLIGCEDVPVADLATQLLRAGSHRGPTILNTAFYCKIINDDQLRTENETRRSSQVPRLEGEAVIPKVSLEELAIALNDNLAVPCDTMAEAVDVARLAGPGRPLKMTIERCDCGCEPTIVIERAQRWEKLK